MKVKWQIPVMLLIVLGLILIALTCKDSKKTHMSYIELSAYLLDFGLTINEQQLSITESGDIIDTVGTAWKIDTLGIPFWAEVNPKSGDLEPINSYTNTVRVRVDRFGIGPGITTAEVVFLASVTWADTSKDTLVLSVEKSCDLLGDDFNRGNAAGWDASGLAKTQNDEGYVTLDPNSAVEPGRLLRSLTDFVVPCIFTARFRHALQEANDNRYGIFLEDSIPENALYYAVNVDLNTNYSFHQFKNGAWKTHRTGKTNLISTQAGDWNILRLELYEADQKLYARGFAGTSTLPLFDNVELGTDLKFTKAGIRSDEYTIDVDWFCGTRR